MPHINDFQKREEPNEVERREGKEKKKGGEGGKRIKMEEVK